MIVMVVMAIIMVVGSDDNDSECDGFCNGDDGAMMDHLDCSIG